MVRTWQPKHASGRATASEDEREVVAIGSESDDDIGTEQEEPVIVKPKASAKTSTKSKQPTVPKPRAKKEEMKDVKGKGKTTIDDVEMEVEADEPRTKTKRPVPISASSIGSKRATDPESLIKENEKLRSRVAELEALLDELTELRSTKREEELLGMIEHMELQMETKDQMLDMRNNDFIKSQLVNRDPNSTAGFVSMQWAEAATEQVTEKLKKQVEAAEAAAKRAEVQAEQHRKNASEMKQQVSVLQRELDAEIANSKRLHADIGRKPTPAAPSRTAGGPAISHEAQKKLELFEGLTGLAILSYTESIRQPENAKSVTFTCMLTIEDKVDFPFKLVIWDQKLPGEIETEHVVYSPGEPIDPELDLQYLRNSFTFPRSQMAVFYTNMIGILNPLVDDEGDDDSEEAE